MKFASRFGEIELTEERQRHILTFHPEVRAHIKYLSKTLASSKTIRHSKFDLNVIIFYSELIEEKYLAIVVKTNTRNFILTAYTTNKIKHLL